MNKFNFYNVFKPVPTLDEQLRNAARGLLRPNPLAELENALRQPVVLKPEPPDIYKRHK